MTLEQLRVFVAVAERQHVTRAAEALNIAQSAVSASIAALEGRHGAKLFHRVGRRIELTEAGALFLAEARAVLARAESAELVLSELGELKRYASQIIAGYWLPRYLVDFRRSYPGVAIRLSIGNTSQAAAAVRGGETDLGFVEGEVDSGSYKRAGRARPIGDRRRRQASVERGQGLKQARSVERRLGVARAGLRHPIWL